MSRPSQRLPANWVVIALGANQGGPTRIAARFTSVATACEAFGRVRKSPLYRTAAIGDGLADFVNAVLVIELPTTAGAAGALATRKAKAKWPRVAALMQFLLALEAKHGRQRVVGKVTDRPLDLDIIAWGHRRRHVLGPPLVSLPHPRALQRNFVVAPMRALLGDHVWFPGTRQPLEAVAARVADQALSQLALRW